MAEVPPLNPSAPASYQQSGSPLTRRQRLTMRICLGNSAIRQLLVRNTGRALTAFTSQSKPNCCLYSIGVQMLSIARKIWPRNIWCGSIGEWEVALPNGRSVYRHIRRPHGDILRARSLFRLSSRRVSAHWFPPTWTAASSLSPGRRCSGEDYGCARRR